MNKKLIGVIVGVLLLFIIVCSGSILNNDNYEFSYYVEASSNFFSRCGILINDCCYYAIDIIISGISSLFELLLK